MFFTAEGKEKTMIEASYRHEVVETIAGAPLTTVSVF